MEPLDGELALASHWVVMSYYKIVLIGLILITTVVIYNMTHPARYMLFEKNALILDGMTGTTWVGDTDGGGYNRIRFNN